MVSISHLIIYTVGGDPSDIVREVYGLLPFSCQFP